MSIAKNFFKMLGLHALCSFGTMLFILMFPGIIDFTFGQIIFSLLAIFVFFDIFFTSAWTMANKEYKSIKIYNNHLPDGETPKKTSMKNGIIIACLYAIFGLIFWAVSFALSSDNSGVSILAFRVWFSEFIVAYMYSVRHIRHLSFVIAVSPFIPIVLGYFCGLKNKNYIDEFVRKLVYKSKKNTANKK